MIKSIYILLVLIGAYSAGISCSCIYIPTFCETLTYYEFDKRDSNVVIVRAKILKHKKAYAELEVLDQLIGPKTAQFMEVVSGDGANCWSFMDNFGKGTEWIMLLNPITYESTTPLRYGLSICGVTFLEVRNNHQVVGQIATDVSEILYKDFIKLEECGDFNSDYQEIKLLQNPVGDQCRIEFTFPQPSTVKVIGQDAIGRKIFIRNIQIPVSNQPWVEEFSTINWPLGMIYIKITGIREEKVLKVLKVY